MTALLLGALCTLAHAAAPTWSTRAPLPEARTEVSVTTDGRQIFLIGGYAPGLSMPRAMQVYDPRADRWSTPTNLPVGLNHTAVVHVAGKLYIIGGWTGMNRDPTGAVHIYDIASQRWSTGAAMPTPRAAHALAVLDGRIHAIGGHADRAQSLDRARHGVGADHASVGTHEAYDPRTNTWTRLAPMPTPRNHVAAVALDGRLHVVGGRVGNDYTMTTHEIYDARTDTWSAGPPLPTGRSGIAAVALDGRMYVFGGEAAGTPHKTFAVAERYDPKTNRWDAMPPMPTARHGLGAAAAGGAIHVVSGGPQPGGSFSGLHEVLAP